MSEFYDECFDPEWDCYRASTYAYEFSINKRRFSHEQERRSFYKYICKIGFYEPMKFLRTFDGQTLMYRRRFDNYMNGYPSFDASRSSIKDNWYEKRSIMFGKAMMERADREHQRDKIIDEFRRARRESTQKAYKTFFSGIGQDNVGWPVLFLANSLLRLREVMKNKNCT